MTALEAAVIRKQLEDANRLGALTDAALAWAVQQLPTTRLQQGERQLALVELMAQRLARGEPEAAVIQSLADTWGMDPDSVRRCWRDYLAYTGNR